MAEEPAALDSTKRRLELWKQSTSRKLMIQVLPNRVCSIAAITVYEKGASGETAAKSPGRNLQCRQHHRHRAAAVPRSRAEKL